MVTEGCYKSVYLTNLLSYFTEIFGTEYTAHGATVVREIIAEYDMHHSNAWLSNQLQTANDKATLQMSEPPTITSPSR